MPPGPEQQRFFPEFLAAGFLGCCIRSFSRLLSRKSIKSRNIRLIQSRKLNTSTPTYVSLFELLSHSFGTQTYFTRENTCWSSLWLASAWSYLSFAEQFQVHLPLCDYLSWVLPIFGFDCTFKWLIWTLFFCSTETWQPGRRDRVTRSVNKSANMLRNSFSGGGGRVL